MKIPLTISFLKYCFVFLFLSSNILAQNTDINLLKKINNSRNRSLDPAMKGITNSAPFISAGTPLVILSYGLIQDDSLIKRNALVAGAALITSGIITTSLKYAVNRPRPFVTYSFIEKGANAGPYSFPSGHTSEAFALSTSLSLAYPKLYVIVPAYFWASAVAYSRMHLGMHYPSDVLAGALIGTGSSYLCYKLNKILLKKHSSK